jgi:hypothetical protein
MHISLLLRCSEPRCGRASPLFWGLPSGPSPQGRGDSPRDNSTTLSVLIGKTFHFACLTNFNLTMSLRTFAGGASMRAVRALHTTTGTELTEDERALLFNIQSSEERLAALETQSTLALLARVEATRLHRQCEIDLQALKQKRLSEVAGAKRAEEAVKTVAATAAGSVSGMKTSSIVSTSSSKPLPPKLNLSRFTKSQVPPGTKDIWAEPPRAAALSKVPPRLGGL